MAQPELPQFRPVACSRPFASMSWAECHRDCVHVPNLSAQLNRLCPSPGRELLRVLYMRNPIAELLHAHHNPSTHCDRRIPNNHQQNPPFRKTPQSNRAPAMPTAPTATENQGCQKGV